MFLVDRLFEGAYMRWMLEFLRVWMCDALLSVASVSTN